MPRKSKAAELIWANEVMEVYRNLGTMPNSRDWSTPSASHLFDWVGLEENKGKFLSMMVPKASDLLAKLSPEDVTEAVLEIDQKTLKELKRHLHLAIEASQEEKKPEPPVPPKAKPIITLEDIL